MATDHIVEAEDKVTVEQIVLVDDDGRPIGTARKALIHSSETPLHLGFSCYVFDEQGRLLLTRRSRGKVTWPGFWSNSFCGHPGPDEPVTAAVHRRARFELGLTLGNVEILIPDFRYRAIENGIVENEICPVTAARVQAGAPRPNPAEVEDWRWVPWNEVGTAIDGAREATSPWFAAQHELLVQSGWSPTALGRDGAS